MPLFKYLRKLILRDLKKQVNSLILAGFRKVDFFFSFRTIQAKFH